MSGLNLTAFTALAAQALYLLLICGYRRFVTGRPWLRAVSGVLRWWRWLMLLVWAVLGAWFLVVLARRSEGDPVVFAGAGLGVWFGAGGPGRVRRLGREEVVRSNGSRFVTASPKG